MKESSISNQFRPTVAKIDLAALRDPEAVVFRGRWLDGEWLRGPGAAQAESEPPLEREPAPPVAPAASCDVT